MANPVPNPEKIAPTARKSNLPEWAKANPQAKEVAPKPAWSLLVNERMAWIAAAGVSLALLVVFGIGYQAAKKITTRELEAKHRAEMAEIVHNMAPMQQGASPPVVVLPASAVPAVLRPAAQVPASLADPRMPGLNYLGLCQVPVSEGEKLAVFLATKGQHTWRVPVAKDPRMVTIYATNQGFAAAQRGEMERFRAEIRSLGDKWAKSNKTANPFRSMAWEKYAK